MKKCMMCLLEIVPDPHCEETNLKSMPSDVIPLLIRSSLFNYWKSKIRGVFEGGASVKTYALVAAAVILWASWPALATLVHPAPPFLVLGLSAFVGFACSYLVASAKGQAAAFFAIPKRTMLFVAVCLMGNNAFYLAAISRIGPAEANVVHYLWPVFLVAIASLVHRRSPSLIQVLGISAGFCGVAVALSPQLGHNFDMGGVVLGICGALTFAIYSVGRSLAQVESNVVGPSLGLAAAIAIFFHVAMEPSYWPTTGQWIAIAMMGIGPFTLANVFWDKATRTGSAATISSLAFLTPLVAISILSVFGLGTVTMATLIGAALAIIGALLSSRA